VANGIISPDYLRPYKGYSTITAYSTQFDSNYNSLQASLLHRLRAGLSFQASYTYSKALTDNTGPNSSYIALPQDTYNLRAEYGPADFDRTHILTFNYSWDLPLFRHATGFKKSVLGGWQVSGITVFQSGAPNSVVLSSDNAGVGNFNGNERPNQVGDPFHPGPIAANPTCVAPPQVHTLQNWFNPCAFEMPAPGTFGNERIGVIRGPRYQNWDFGIGKNFALRESMGLQFKFEAFNVFNHPSLSLPTYSAGLYLTPDYSQPFSAIDTATSPRILQLNLALKF
jgi:hypothetical protein